MGPNGRVTQRRGRIALMVLIVVCFTASGARADYPHVTRQAIAGSSSYHVADRPNGAEFIDSIMIHDTEETYEGTVAAFTDPKAGASTQYAVSGEDGSSDPAVTQFVADKNWTKNVNNFWFNQHSIGIERAISRTSFTSAWPISSGGPYGSTGSPWTARTSSGTTTSRTP
jgi:hypothetical protein